MRQVIVRGLGIGFVTPIGFIDEIRRGELVHVPLAEPGLSAAASASWCRAIAGCRRPPG